MNQKFQHKTWLFPIGLLVAGVAGGFFASCAENAPVETKSVRVGVKDADAGAEGKTSDATGNRKPITTDEEWENEGSPDEPEPTAETGEQLLFMTWAPNVEEDLKGYKVYVSTDGGEAEEVGDVAIEDLEDARRPSVVFDADSTKEITSGWKSGTVQSLCFTVTAWNDFGESPISEAACLE